MLEHPRFRSVYDASDSVFLIHFTVRLSLRHTLGIFAVATTTVSLMDDAQEDDIQPDGKYPDEANQRLGPGFTMRSRSI